MPEFRLHSPYQASGDQPAAIAAIVENFRQGLHPQVLLGVTGSGKTFTMASIIQALQTPSLVLSHNKTLAAQLYREFKDYFPENAVEYFVSYYDYYQPEAYVPQRDLYIEKESQINDEIERMRVSSVASLLDRQDVLVVASVSCIYGLGAPTDYKELVLFLKVGMEINQEDILRHLVRIQYERSDFDIQRAAFRVKGDSIDIHVAYSREVIRVEMFGDEIESIKRIHFLTGQVLETMDRILIYPAKLFLTTDDKIKKAVYNIEEELASRLEELKAQGKLLEAHRLESRTHYDLEMLQEMGYCNGIENYSRHLSFRAAGDRPFILLDYFPEDFLFIIDESHASIPQLGGMYNGDRARKQTLVDFGFRLPSAMDNRPLKFEETAAFFKRTLFVSATPGPFEMEHAQAVVEQIIRPTGLVDPEVEVRPTQGQIEDIMLESRQRIAAGERILITTLTKKMAEDLSEYLTENGFSVKYLHSEIETIERVEILRDLRLGKHDIVVGINLLREGIDLPEVSLVCILDADKMGFLRGERSLIQTIGRSARNVNGKVILYADTVSEAMRKAMDETDRRRAIQIKYNQDHGITPQTIIKEVHDILERKQEKEEEQKKKDAKKLIEDYKKKFVEKDLLLRELEALMFQYAEDLQFEDAARVRDEIKEMKKSGQ